MATLRKKSSSKNKNKTVKNKPLTKFSKISPQTTLKLLNEKNVAIVNTLSNSIFISSEDSNINNLFGMNFEKKSCDKLKKFRLIVLYCANYTCSASKTYAKKLIEKCSGLKEKIVLYEGGTNEWALLSMKYPEKFLFYNSETKKNLNEREIEEQFISMGHRNESTKKEKYSDIVLKNQQDKRFFETLSSDLPSKFCKSYSSAALKDKVCVVTGGTSGLGLAVVNKMLNSGAKHVTLTYYHDKERAKKVQKELSKKYDEKRFYVLRADARTVKGNMLTFDKQERKSKLNLNVGPIDCVDVNAGIFGPANLHKKHVFNIKEKDYEKTMDTNLKGYFLSMKYFSKQAIENGVKNAAIVCIKSIYGSTGSLFSNIAYQTSKHGVMGLVHQAAVELARSNEMLKIKYPIRVNAVSPTFTDTSLTKPFLDKEKINNTLKNSNTMGHLAYKDNVAEAVLFLLSDKAKCITGIDLPVDCGVLAESIPTYREVKELNKAGIDELSCCGDKI